MEIRFRRTTDPAVNLAAEEWYLEQRGSFFLLWRNESSVIIGRNQNAYAQVNLPEAEVRGIPVIRRLSGGGAVFHDLGNLNYSIITDQEDGAGIDFARFEAPILEALRALGVTATLSGRNDLMAGGGKISGTAQCVIRTSDGRRRLLHHGTLLLGADLSAMSALLRADPAKFRGKGIDSVRSRVRNLADLPEYTGPREADRLAEVLVGLLSGDGRQPGEESPAELAEITALAEAKYRTWKWNYGDAASFETVHRARYPFGSVSAELTAEEGVIRAIRLTGDYFGTRETGELEAALTGCPLRPEALRKRLADVPVGAVISGMTEEQLIELLLGREES